MKENSFNYKVLAIFIFGFGLLMFERGFFWTKEQNTVLSDSDFYLTLHQVMPIWLWGVLECFSVCLSFLHLSFYLNNK